MAEHEHERGSMDITEQQRTFDGFLRVCAAVLVVSILVLIVLAAFRT